MYYWCAQYGTPFWHFIHVSFTFSPKRLELSKIIPIFAALLGSPWR